MERREATLANDRPDIWHRQEANIGPLIIRIGLWGPLSHYTIIMIRNPQNSIGKYEGPYMKP